MKKTKRVPCAYAHCGSTYMNNDPNQPMDADGEHRVVVVPEDSVGPHYCSKECENYANTDKFFLGVSNAPE